MSKIKYWRYGDTSARYKSQIELYLTILNFLHTQNKPLNDDEIFSFLYEKGIKRNQDPSKNSDTSLIKKTLKWLSLIEETPSGIILSQKAIELLSPLKDEIEFNLYKFFGFNSYLELRFFSIFLNDNPSKRTKDYKDFNVIPTRLLFKLGKISNKQQVQKLMIQKSFSEIIEFDDLYDEKIVFRKPSSGPINFHEWLIKLPESNYEETLKIFEQIFSFANKAGDSYFIIKMISQELMGIKKDINNTIKKKIKDIVIKYFSLCELEKRKLIIKYQLQKNLGEFLDLNVRWFSGFNLLVKKIDNYVFAEGFKILIDYFEHTNRIFFSTNEEDYIDLTLERNELWSFLKDKPSIKIEYDNKIPFTLDEVNEALDLINRNENFFQWKEKYEIDSVVSKPTCFEYLILLKIWHLIDGKNINNFIESINTKIDHETLMPILNAPGGVPDGTFEFDNKYVVNIEPTMLEAEDSILKNELQGVKRHLDNVSKSLEKECVLVCLNFDDDNKIKKLIGNYQRFSFQTNFSAEKHFLFPLSYKQIRETNSKEKLVSLIDWFFDYYSNN